MIIAELHGKLGVSASSYEISEDILTSNIFQLMRYLPPELGIIPFINSVLEYNDKKTYLDHSRSWETNYHFWPVGTKRGREPDVLICLKSKESTYVFVIEAKYFSGPSDFEEIDEKTESVYGNQLSDQYIDLLNRGYRVGGNLINVNAPQDNCFILYLTKHNIKPKEEINRAINQFQKNFPEIKNRIESQLLWTNWTKIWSILKKVEIEEFPFNLIKNDLVSLLEKKGFMEFSGFKLDNWTEKYISFYNEIWFDFYFRGFDLDRAGFYEEK